MAQLRRLWSGPSDKWFISISMLIDSVSRGKMGNTIHVGISDGETQGETTFLTEGETIPKWYWSGC